MHKTPGAYEERVPDADVVPQQDASDDGQLDPADFEPRALHMPALRRTLTVLGILVALGLAISLPPLLNVNRFRRQIATSISGSLGRPVHMDAVKFNLLPMPSFTLENFVVGEDAGFGSEPVIRANSVSARLRMRSLWRRRVEFSRISLTDTSLNLVHRADGRWNIESILLQAAKLDAAPTAQKAGGSAPRFPYIEATNARVNVKMGLEKMPLALTETEFALWLPQPQQWQLRLVGHPSRTDNAATDTGSLRVQGTLGKASELADVPLNLTAEWSGAPLGAVSWVLLGRDADFRGEMTLNATMAGSMGRNVLSTRLALRGARRSEFVPVRSLDLDIACRARVEDVFHRLEQVECAAPADAPTVRLTGQVGDCLDARTAQLELEVRRLDAARLADALRLGSARVPAALHLGGSVDGRVELQPLHGEMTLTHGVLALGSGAPLMEADASAEIDGEHASFGPVPLALGGEATLAGRVDRSGYSLHLAGSVLRSRLLALGEAVPQFGDGLRDALPPVQEKGAAETPIRVDLVSNRTWTGGQTWSAAAVPVRPAQVRRGRRVRR